MATFGQGIRPELGRIDYTPYLQGAAQGAQMSGRAATMAWENIGAGIEKGLESYDKMKKENKEKDARLKEGRGMLEALAKTPGINPDLQAKSLTMLQRLNETGIPVDAKLSEIGGALAEFNTTMKLGSEAVAKQLEERKMQVLESQARSEALRAAQTRQQDLSFQEQAVGAEVGSFQQANGRMPNQAELATIYSKVAKLSQQQTNIDMGGNAFDRQVGTNSADRKEKEYSAAIAAPSNINKLDAVSEILNSGDVTTGIGAEIFNNINRIRSGFLADEKAGKKVSNTQILDAMLGSDVFTMISALGIGARGLDTPAERDFLRQVMTGTKELNAESIQGLVDFRRDKEIRALRMFKDNDEKGAYKRYFEMSQNVAPDYSVLESKAPTKKASPSKIKTWNPAKGAFE